MENSHVVLSVFFTSFTTVCCALAAEMAMVMIKDIDSITLTIDEQAINLFV
jgi:hypothetical protein